VKIRLARRLGTKDPGKANELLEQTEQEVSQALEDLRDLARGIYPPLLADRGLVAALSSQVRRSPVPVEIQADGIGRYPQEAEAAVVFQSDEAGFWILVLQLKTERSDIPVARLSRVLYGQADMIEVHSGTLRGLRSISSQIEIVIGMKAQISQAIQADSVKAISARLRDAL